MRIYIALVVILLFCHSSLAAQKDTTKKRGATTISSVITEINQMYDNMEKSIELEYAKLVKENKTKTDELNAKIKEMDQQVEKLKAQAKKIEEVSAKMQALMQKMMKGIGNDRQNLSRWGVETHQNRLIAIRDSLKKTLPVQTAAKKDSLIRLTQIH